MLAIIIFLILPVVLFARLLGAEWDLAIFIGLIWIPAAVTSAIAIAYVAETIQIRRQRKRARKRVAERGRPLPVRQGRPR